MPPKKKPTQKMGQQPNKYHIADDGKIYRINEDGSFTSMGNVEDIEKKPTPTSVHNPSPIPSPSVKTSSVQEVGWWKRNYNWLWVTTLILFLGWFISCLSCAWPEYYVGVIYYREENSGQIMGICAIILLCYALSWLVSKKKMIIFKISQVVLIGYAGWEACKMHWLCEQAYSDLLVCLATVPFALWIITLGLCIFKHKN